MIFLNYLAFSILNLATIKWASKNDLIMQFIFTRGLFASTSLLIGSRVLKIPVSFLQLKASQLRILFGGGGLALSFLGGYHLNSALYATLQRSDLPLLYMYERKKLKKSGFLLISILFIICIFFEFYIGVTLCGATLLTMSRVYQKKSISTEPPFLLPFAPAISLLMIGAMGICLQNIQFKISIPGVLSAFVMIAAYWISAPIIKKKGVFVICLMDVIAGILVALLL